MSELTRQDIEKLTKLSVDMEYIKETLSDVLKEQKALRKEISTLVIDHKNLSDKVDRLKEATAKNIDNIGEKSTRFGRFIKANWWRIWGIGSGISVLLVSWLADHLYHLPPPH